MKKILFVLVFVLIFSHPSWTAKPGKYIYTVDLVNVVEDKILVELTVPPIRQQEILFYLPKIIPGTYSIADYGRFVNDFRAYDKRGNELIVDHPDENTWKISNANKLRRISYWVNDSFDFEGGEPYIFEPAGTNIENGQNYLLNAAGIFGYFDGLKKTDFEFNIIRDKEFYGGTGLKAERIEDQYPKKIDMELSEAVQEDVRVDTYVTGSYDDLVDSPLMYCKPDTTIIRVANTEVLISSYSPNNIISSGEISESIKEILMAQKEYLGGHLPVDKYAFLFYFVETPGKFTGALEHSYSSVYYLKEEPIDQLRQMLRDVSAHEFFHIITPLNIHSEEIHTFDFNDPKMSKHLWLYEGVTEYFAGNMQVKSSIITVNQYLTMIRNQMVNNTLYYKNELPFTEFSENILEHQSEFGNVYQKGALIGMCLDIKLRYLSNGKYGMQNLMRDLAGKFGKDQPFKDDELFDHITEITYPEVGEFLETHVGQNNPLPFREIFQLVGIEYVSQESKQEYSIGINNQSVGYDQETGRFYISKEETLDDFGKALGLKKGDIILEINGMSVPQLSEIREFLGGIRSEMKEGDDYSIKVLRGDDTNPKEEKILRTPIFKTEKHTHHLIRLMDNPSEDQLKIRKAWLKDMT